MATPAGITAPPSAPSRSSPATFSADAEAFVAWFSTFLDDWAGLDAADFFPVQSSLTDPTQNRAMLTGAFGLGGGYMTQLSAANALDTLSETGFWAVLGADVATVNGPTGAGVGLVQNMMWNSGNRVQFYMEVGASAGIWQRRYSDSSWGDWYQMFSQKNLIGTVSQSSGDPTGDAMERGSNANGEYVRLADGTQICTRVFDHTLSMSAAGSVYTENLSPWTFPANFVSGSVPSFHCNMRACWGGADNVTNGYAIPKVYSHDDKSTSTRKAHLLAVGRWF